MAKAKTMPRLWRRKRGGVEFGAWHIYIANKPINLGTDDAELARARRDDAVKRGARRWPRKFRDTDEGAAARVVAALDGAAYQVAHENGNASGSAGQPHSSTPHAPAGLLLPIPPADAPAGSAAEPERVDAEPIPPEPARPWTDDVGAAAGASADAAASAADAAPDGARTTHIGDLPILAGMFVTVSRLLVQVQIAGQVVAARKLAKLDVPLLADPPPKDLAEFLEQQGKPWPVTDPREAGRQMWEGFLRRIMPQDIPVPDWIMAPILVGIGTLPVQLANAKKIDPNAPKPAAGEQPQQQPAEAPPVDAQAAA